MKYFFSLLLVLPLISLCQVEQTQKTTYLLLDRTWRKPVRQVDTITSKDLSEGWYPIYTTELDNFEQLIRKFKDVRNDALNRKYYNLEDFKIGTFSIAFSSTTSTYGDRYDITIYSATGIGQTSFKLSDLGDSINLAHSNVNSILLYLSWVKKYIKKPIKKQKPEKFGY